MSAQKPWIEIAESGKLVANIRSTAARGLVQLPSERMPITYQIEPDRRWIEIKLTGAISAEETVAHMKQMYADPAYSDDLCGIVDCRGMTNVLNLTDVRGVAEMQLARPGPAWRSKRAVVVSSPEQYGTARVFMVFAESSPVQYSVFYNMEAALQWLKE